MKIYEIGTGYTPIPARMGAATEIVVEELTRAFLKQGAQVEIIDIAASDRAPHQLPIREVRVPKCFAGTDVQLGIMHKLKRVVYSVSLARTLQKILKQSDEKVLLHFHNQYNLFFFLKLTPKKLREKGVIAYTNHSGIWRLNWCEIEDTIRKRYFQEAECMKRADLAFLLNEETKRNVMEHLGVPEKRMVVINNGVNTDVYHPLPEDEKRRAKRKWNLEGQKVILQVGSVYENKGQLRSAEYLLPLLKADPKLVFAYAGGVVDEDYQQKIRAFAEEHGLAEQIRYLGMLSPGTELNELYNTAAATMLPSKYESFGLVVIESFSSGVPVLLNRNGPFHFGEGSITFEHGDFSGAVNRKVFGDTEEYQQLCDQARKNARENYSWDKIARDYRGAWEK